MGAYAAARRHHHTAALQEEDDAGEAPSAALGQGRTKKQPSQKEGGQHKRKDDGGVDALHYQRSR